MSALTKAIVKKNSFLNPISGTARRAAQTHQHRSLCPSLCDENQESNVEHAFISVSRDARPVVIGGRRGGPLPCAPTFVPALENSKILNEREPQNQAPSSLVDVMITREGKIDWENRPFICPDARGALKLFARPKKPKKKKLPGPADRRETLGVVALVRERCKKFLST